MPAQKSQAFIAQPIAHMWSIDGHCVISANLNCLAVGRGDPRAMLEMPQEVTKGLEQRELLIAMPETISEINPYQNVGD